MPTYELTVLLRTMTRPEITSTLKRTADSIFSSGGVIRKIDSLGLLKTPYKISSHGAVHREANYFLIYFDASPSSILNLGEGFSRDIDIVRQRIYKQITEDPKPCTLSEEVKPPAYRLEVQKMMEIAKAQQKKKFEYNTGLDYYPFQR
ncbi:probable 28S ribosomal protein S6, mitochondrial [Athalia rosae]|uniref:probable 28S ribosomal protein S6, mitochondrial n=1 Tax=Athalia rosae TaxID=37344 RepID=UPI0020345401|nr:probable 28S ribosomal protein S6, mitochondrial [Athalia rosae]